MLILAALLGTVLAAATPQTVEPTFTRAYLKPESLCFDSPVDIDWEALARRELKEFPIDKPTREDIRRQEWEWGVKFYAGLPETFKGLHFYLLAETGPQPIVPERLEGIIRYDFRSSGKPVLEGFHGTICLSVPKALRDAGFVATSSVPLTWQTAPATLVGSGATTFVRLQEGYSSLPAPEFTKKAVQVKCAYLLSSAELGTRYVVVRRLTDRGSFCEFVYGLYRWEPELPVVADNAYRCDV